MEPPEPVPSSVRITARDVGMFAGLFESRIMERRHMTALFFDGKDAMAKERIGKKLVPAGYLKVQNPLRHRTERAVYGLGRRGFEELRARGIIEQYESQTAGQFSWRRLEDRLVVSPWTIQHEIAVMDTKVVLVTALRRQDGYAVSEFSTWPLLFQFRALNDKTVKPDGYLRLTRPLNADTLLEESLYLEVDRGTEAQDTLVEKARAYAAYSGSPDFARWLGAGDSERIYLRTLFVFASRPECGSAAERRNNFLDQLLRTAGVNHVVWATTSEDLNRQPLGAIWMTPVDYAKALAGTRFDPLSTGTEIRNRSTDRDALVRERVIRRELFPPVEVTP